MKTEKKFIPLNIEPLLVDAARLSVILSCSISHIHSLDNSAAIPKAIFLGKSRRWILSEIRSWTEAGCPSRIEWMQNKGEGKL